MKKKKLPGDLCDYCGHARKDHSPPTTYTSVNTTRAMTARGAKVLAKFCCWANIFCSCIEFVEHDAPHPRWYEFGKRFLDAATIKRFLADGTYGNVKQVSRKVSQRSVSRNKAR